MTRMTRAEKQAHTRECLLVAAGKVFSKRGLQQASIDEVAGEAGYTKGAFYANFKSKEELFLAMLDEKFAQRLEELEELVSRDLPLADTTRRAGESFTEALRADEEWERLFFEFSAHAARDPEFREELATRYRALREAKARIFASVGMDSAPISCEDIATMTFAMANGLALEQLLEPDAVPDEMYGKMLYAFFLGLKAMEADTDADRLDQIRDASRAAST
jgi:AcrR family transcriptional regulator